MYEIYSFSPIPIFLDIDRVSVVQVTTEWHTLAVVNDLHFY